MGECVFCGIVAGRIPAKIVFADAETMAFEDLNPAAPVHVLVVPCRHVASLTECTDDDTHLLGRLHRTAAAVARAKALSDYRVVINTGAEAGQSVFHLHLHVLGGRALQWPPG